MTTAEDLRLFVKKTLKDKKFVVAIQREPYLHINTLQGVKLKEVAGGAHALLDGILKETGGLMVAVAGGDADALTSDKKGRIQVPPDRKRYTLKRIFLKKKETQGFYYGFANQTLWPLCHAVFVKPIFDPAWWDEYVKVNKKFASAILSELNGKDAFVWINDYHLALLPKMLKDKKPNLTIGTFWHIPWPAYEILRICPWRRYLLEGLLGSDFIGFHRGYHVENFVDGARRVLETIVDPDPRSVVHAGRRTRLNYLPAGIDYHEIVEKVSAQKNAGKRMLKKEFGFESELLAIGVDRIDYTKGIIERLNIIDKFFEKYPQFQGKLVYLSLAAPSRLYIPSYKNLYREIIDLVEKINWKYSSNGWQPIRFVDKILPREKIFSCYKLADVCLVTSLDDGMNLVAKEFVICTQPGKGALLLSKFTGAAKDLTSAFLINPYDVEDSADHLYKALTLKKEEKARRMNEMKALVRENNIYNWAVEFIKHTVS